ncbi:MAG: hypothetical protein ACM3IL_05035 [Deltaproteobacteria bacterium]
MLKRICSCVLLSIFVFFMSGCGAILATAMSAAATYGIYQATRK